VEENIAAADVGWRPTTCARSKRRSSMPRALATPRHSSDWSTGEHARTRAPDRAARPRWGAVNAYGDL